MNSRKSRMFIILAAGLLLAVVSLWVVAGLTAPTRFDGQRAYQDVLAQVAFGPRIPGSSSHAQEVIYIISELEEAGWQVVLQNTTWEGFPVENIIAYRGIQGEAPTILLGAHYDSRLFADQDTGPGAGEAVPGANDGASGVAVLLELARTLPEDIAPVWLVFFDAEDNGGLEGRDWAMGSRAFVASLAAPPQAVVIVDMVGDEDLNLNIEATSDPALAEEIWGLAADLGYEQFIQETRFSLLDDHTPFLEAGIPAAVIIDFEYPFWHTTADTTDKVSPASLQAVGDTLWAWVRAK
ncbi:MAG: M28 family peptidase [Chloroflexi bacterium]|nr:M28 family peptidase [Chloroflexota bacterium]